MAKYFALMDDGNDTVAVGPFVDDDAASDWAHVAEYERALGTCRGVVRQVASTRWMKGQR